MSLRPSVGKPRGAAKLIRWGDDAAREQRNEHKGSAITEDHRKKVAFSYYHPNSPHYLGKRPFGIRDGYYFRKSDAGFGFEKLFSPYVIEEIEIESSIYLDIIRVNADLFNYLKKETLKEFCVGGNLYASMSVHNPNKNLLCSFDVILTSGNSNIKYPDADSSDDGYITTLAVSENLYSKLQSFLNEKEIQFYIDKKESKNIIIAQFSPISEDSVLHHKANGA